MSRLPLRHLLYPLPKQSQPRLFPLSKSLSVPPCPHLRNRKQQDSPQPQRKAKNDDRNSKHPSINYTERHGICDSAPEVLLCPEGKSFREMLGKADSLLLERVA